MTILELKTALNRYPDDWQVVMSKDAEGNSFSPLEDFAAGEYIPDNAWSGEFQAKAEPEDMTNALCLWPVE